MPETITSDVLPDLTLCECLRDSDGESRREQRSNTR